MSSGSGEGVEIEKEKNSKHQHWVDLDEHLEAQQAAVDRRMENKYGGIVNDAPPS